MLYTLSLSMKWGAKDMVHEQKQPVNSNMLWTCKQKKCAYGQIDRLLEQGREAKGESDRERERDEQKSEN